LITLAIAEYFASVTAVDFINLLLAPVTLSAVHQCGFLSKELRPLSLAGRILTLSPEKQQFKIYWPFGSPAGRPTCAGRGKLETFSILFKS